MTNKEYREFIKKLLDRISNERVLRQIYKIVHIKFINQGAKDVSAD